MDDWMRWEPTKSRRFSSLLLTPARVVVGIGAALAAGAGLMPWAEGTAPAFRGIEPVFFSGLGGAGDGVVMLLVATATGLLTLHRTPAESRVRSVRLAPAILVVLAAATWVNGYRAALLEIAAWERRGGSGSIAPGLWLAGIGILLMAAGTAWLLPQAIRWRHRSDDPADLVTFDLGEAAALVGGLAGTLAGAAAGIALALSVTGPMIVGMIALAAVFGGLLGAYAGARLARAMVAALPGRRGRAARTAGGGSVSAATGARTAGGSETGAPPATGTRTGPPPARPEREFRGRVGHDPDRDR